MVLNTVKHPFQSLSTVIDEKRPETNPALKVESLPRDTNEAIIILYLLLKIYELFLNVL